MASLTLTVLTTLAHLRVTSLTHRLLYHNILEEYYILVGCQDTLDLIEVVAAALLAGFFTLSACRRVALHALTALLLTVLVESLQSGLLLGGQFNTCEWVGAFAATVIVTSTIVVGAGTGCGTLLIVIIGILSHGGHCDECT